LAKLSIIKLLALIFLTVAGTSVIGQDRSASLKVLFIGNSLTYANDVPGMIEALAKASRQRRFEHESITLPDHSLEDHWNKGNALKKIQKGKWDFVVMQQGPSAGKEGREVLLKYGKLFGDEIKKKGATPAMYMVWPAAGRAQDFPGVSETYLSGARAVGGLFLPVGEAWLSALRIDREIILYSQDGFHPSVVGSYLAALVIFEKMYGQTPVGLPSKLSLRSGTKVDIPAKDAEILQRAAKETNERFGAALKN
jgi:hypothetical protein